MYIELYWKDYRRFGADGSVDALAKWLMSRLCHDYGDARDPVMTKLLPASWVTDRAAILRALTLIPDEGAGHFRLLR